MSMIDKEPERHEIEALLPWYAAGTLSRRDADLVERVLAGDRELARRCDVVRQELAGRLVSVSASAERHQWRRPPP
jgi:anti-sigma-K factor RskA